MRSSTALIVVFSLGIQSYIALVDAAPAIQAVVGDGHCLVLLEDGTVSAFGSNQYGQILVPSGLSGMFNVLKSNRTSKTKEMCLTRGLSHLPFQASNKSPQATTTTSPYSATEPSECGAEMTTDKLQELVSVVAEFAKSQPGGHRRSR
jgi:hypothetical protein